MLNQTKYNSITVIQSSLTEQSMMVDCPSQADKAAILQSYTTDRADELLATYKSQIDRLLPLQHPNLQSTIDVFVEEHNLHLVTGAVQGKPVATLVPLSEERCEKLLKHILPVISYLHERQITHGNISSHTILLTNQGQPILTNFQAITELIAAAGGDVKPTIAQQLSEISVANIPSGQQFDLYSLGITIIYLLTNRELIHLYDPTTQKWQWETHFRPSSSKLLRAIDLLLNNHTTSAAEVLQEFQTQSKLILDTPPPTQDFSNATSNIYTPTPTPPTNIPKPEHKVSPANTNSTQRNNQPSQSEKKPLSTILTIGAVGGLMMFVGMSIGKNNSNSPTQTSSVPPQITENSSSDSQINQNTNKNPPTTLPITSTPINLTSDDASNLISKWLEAKKSLFGSSYLKSAGENLTTGLAYQRNITDNSGNDRSSVDDLSKDGIYYTYNNQQVHEIKEIRPIGSDEVGVIAIVSEQRTKHNTRTGSTKTSLPNPAKSCYQFKKVGNDWKISKTPELFTSCP